MRAIVRRLVLSLLLLSASAGATVAGARPSGTAGESLYLLGLSAAGKPVRASVQKGVALSGADAACVKCHRRSGLGGGEGQNVIRPITGRFLFEAPFVDPAYRAASPGARQPGRPVYSREDFARALRDGIDPAGRRLDPLMPRYALSEREIEELQAYLTTLSATPAPGVTDTEIHFATIVTPDVAPDKARALVDMLEAFFQGKNGGTRKEVRRRALDEDEMYRAFRTWVLHPWRLTGAPETWRGQLEAYYRAQPVFAVVGGTGNDWRPMHGFCEANEIPCLFPDVASPVAGGEGYYTLYFSRGLGLEADILARQLAADRQAGGSGPIIQVFRDDAAGRQAAAALRESLRDMGIEVAEEHPVSGPGSPSAGFWSDLLGSKRPAHLVVWLDAAELGELGRSGPPPEELRGLYLSATLSAMRPGDLADAWLARVRMAYPYDLPAGRGLQMARMKSWLRSRRIAVTDERTQAGAFFAASIVGDAVAHMGRNFSRDYLIERIEQMTASSLFTSVYPRLSLGPGQRFASRGGYVVRFGPDAAPVPLGNWMVP